MIEATDSLYKSCLALIHSVVLKQCEKTPVLDYDELLSQASLIFCNAAATYDESRGTTFKTHLYNQLKRLSENVDHLYGPSLIRGDKQLLFSLDWYHDVSDASQDQEADAFTSSAEYSRSLGVSGDMDGWEGYRSVLSADAGEIYDTLVSGELDPVPTKAVTAGSREYKKKCFMTPWKLYSGKYRALGWTLERVRLAHSELQRVINQWRSATDPFSVRIVRSIEGVPKARPLFSVG